MVINVFRKHIMNTINELGYYRYMWFAAPDFRLRLYYEKLVYFKLVQLDFLLYRLQKQSDKLCKNKDPYQETQKEFTLEELAYYDGSEGRPAYVAVNGLVYDVSLNATWGGGTHFGLYAGKELTQEFNGCHQNKSILNKLPIVGVLKNKNE